MSIPLSTIEMAEIIVAVVGLSAVCLAYIIQTRNNRK